MPKMVKINGVEVDSEDPCALYQALYAVKLQMLAGDLVEEVSIQSPTSRETVRFSPSSMKDLDAELMRLAQACSKATGGPRTRFAKPMRFI